MASTATPKVRRSITDYAGGPVYCTLGMSAPREHSRQRFWAYRRERIMDVIASPAGDPEGPLIGGKLIQGGILLSGRLVG